MKKVLLWVTAFTLGLASCQKSEVVDDVNAGSNELNFGVYQGKATRAGELTNDALQKASTTSPVQLYVYKGTNNAATDKELYFYDVLRYENAKWKTDIMRFMPKTGTLQLYAFHPQTKTGETEDVVYDDKEVKKANGFPTLTYKIKDTQATQVDLVAAAINDNAGKDIVIPLKHILSQVNFGVKGYEGAKIEIRSIKVNKVYNRGLFDFGTWKWTALDVATGTTAPLEADYNYLFADQTTLPLSTYKTPGTKDDGENTYIFGDGGNWGPGDAATTLYVGKNTDDTDKVTAGTKKFWTEKTTPQKFSNSLMLMPQLLKDGMTNAFATFEYRISDLGDPAAWVVGGPKDVTGIDWIAGKFDLHMGESTINPEYKDEWNTNLRYVYIIDFKGFLDGQKLTFDVDVEMNPWENYDKPGDGIVLLSSLDGTIFKTTISKLAVSAESEIPEGHLFSDITWNWLPYGMTNTFEEDETFKVKFTKVRFNGNTLTIIPPFGFVVSDGTTNDATTIGVTKTETALTFKAIAAYYGNVDKLNDAITGDANYTFNVSTSILLSAVKISTLVTTGNTITLKFASAYGQPVPKDWKLSDSGKTATYTKPAIVP